MIQLVDDLPDPLKQASENKKLLAQKKSLIVLDDRTALFLTLPRLGKLEKYPHLRTEVNLSALKLFSNVIGKMTIMGIVKIMIFFDQNE